MLLGYEFGDPTLQVIEKLGPETVGKWLAFFKYKSELENPKTKTPPNGVKPKPKKGRSK